MASHFTDVFWCWSPISNLLLCSDALNTQVVHVCRNHHSRVKRHQMMEYKGFISFLTKHFF